MRIGNARTVGALALLLASASAYSITPSDDDASRYSVIVHRNGFGLKEPPLVKIDQPPPPEPIKVKLLGLSTILGRKQVLFKILAKPPTRPKEEALMLNEGEAKDDIEVVSIDELNEVVSFRLAGSPVTLSMKDDSEKPPAGPAPAATTPPPPTNVPKPGVAQNTTQPPMSPEVQQILIEANRQKYLDEGNSLAKILPSTGLREKNQPAR